MKGLDELITIFHTRNHWHAPSPIEIRFNHLPSRSNISENYLILHWSRAMLHVMTHQPLYFIVFYGSTVITWHYDSSRRNLFLEDYPISASRFVFRGSNTKLFFTICLLYFSDMLWHDRNITTHLTRDTRPSNDITSFSHLLCSHTC